MDMYKLVDKIPVPCTVEEYGEEHRKDRTVGKTILPDGRKVSTVFLGLDHNWNDDGDPILFESMLFGIEGYSEEHDMDRYCTWDEAYEGHRNMEEKWGGTVSPKDFFDEELFKV
jgi:hypothetical protein